MRKADFLGKNEYIVKGLKLKEIVWNFVQQLKIQQLSYPLTQNTIKAFKFRAQAIFSLLEKHPPPRLQNLSSRIFSPLFYIISTQRYYIYQKQDTNSCFEKLRAISNLFSLFYTPCTYRVSQNPQNYWNNVLLEFECPSTKLTAKMRKILTGCIYYKYWLIKKLKYLR
jgi:hypothetical protein